MNNKSQNRIRFKNIEIEYKALNCELVTIKAFFIGLFKTKYSKVKIKYLCIGKIKKNIKILLQLDVAPDWSSIQNFIFQDRAPSFENCLSPVDLYEELTKNGFQDYGIADFTLDISKLKKSEQENRLDSFLRNLLEVHYQISFSKDEVITKTFEYLQNHKCCFQFDKAIYIKKIESSFNFIIDNLNDDSIRDLETFKVTSQIENLKISILDKLQILAKDNRVSYINIEGESQIGKTELVKAILKYYKISFNYLLGEKLNFTDDAYDDNALVNIFDDSNYFQWAKGEDNLSYVKTIVGCNYKGVFVEANKWEKHRTLKKNKLTIIICNPGKNSFYNWFQSEKNVYKEYIFQQKGEYIEFKNEPLYKTEKKEQEENIGHE